MVIAPCAKPETVKNIPAGNAINHETANAGLNLKMLAPRNLCVTNASGVSGVTHYKSSTWYYQMTIAEKILSSKSGKSSVTPGEIVEAYPDLVMSHTAT